MQFKLVPAAPDEIAFVETVQAALPLVPGSESDCCGRIMERAGITSRDEARTWLTFLRALELATEGPSGFRRTRRDPDPDQLRQVFRDRVYGAETVLELLATADQPLSADAVYERFATTITPYERHKHQHQLEQIWGERVERLLEWAVLLDLAVRENSRYRIAY